MECADILHVLWAGICRDFSGSLIMDTAEWCNLASLQGSAWDERLQTLHHYCVNWCANNGIRPSTVEQLSPLNFLALLQQLTTQICQCSWPYVQYVHHSSIANSLSFFLTIFFSGLQKLGVDAISYDYPLGPSKGYANRVLFLGAFSHSMLQLRGLGLEH